MARLFSYHCPLHVSYCGMAFLILFDLKKMSSIIFDFFPLNCSALDTDLAPIRRDSRLPGHGNRGGGVICRDKAPGPGMDGANVNP